MLVESVQGIRTLKTLGPGAAAEGGVGRSGGDGGVSCGWRPAGLSNWPQTLITPIEFFINRGVLLVGAYLALGENSSVGVGALVAFMMLGARVTQPLVGLARLLEDFTEVRAAVGEVGSVLNNKPEQQSGSGLRPDI